MMAVDRAFHRRENTFSGQPQWENADSKRKYYLDNIRFLTVLLVIVYHVVYVFNSVGVITNIDVQGIPQMDVLLYFVYPWFMNLLFVVAGMSARYSLEKRNDRAFLKERTKRLLVPSIAGIFLLGWVSGWVTAAGENMETRCKDTGLGAGTSGICCLGKF